MSSYQEGQALGTRFRIIRLLGRGGMGEVWLAEDAELREQVALKLIHPQLALNPGMLELLRHECRSTRRLSHPNIVRVYDLHQQDDAHFLSMQFVDGDDLAERSAKQGLFTWQEAATLLQPLAEALDHAHGIGIIHRDLKSNNVMVDPLGQPLLADFGIAGVLRDNPGGVDLRSGGSLKSMSPQQLEKHPPSASDDLYSLGALSYELLTGNPPFYPDISVDRIRTEVPPQIGRGIPSDLESLVAALLSKHPGDRPTSAREVIKALAGLSASNTLPPEDMLTMVKPQPADFDLTKETVDIREAKTRVAPPPASVEAAPIERIEPIIERSVPQAPTGGETASRMGMVMAVLGVLAVLLLVGGVLFFQYLKRNPIVAPPDPEPVVVVAPTNAPPDVVVVPAPSSEEELAQLAAKGDADKLFADLTVKKSKLEKLAVEEWGGASYSNLVQHASTGDSAMLDKQFLTASNEFSQAIAFADGLFDQVKPAFKKLVTDGRMALSEGDGDLASRKFNVALKLEPDDAFVKTSLERAKNIEAVWALFTEGQGFEKQKQWRRALTSYQEARKLDPKFGEAQVGLVRVKGLIEEEVFQERMTAGMNALAQKDYAGAKLHLVKALGFRPSSKEIQDGLLQADAGIQREKIAVLQREAAKLEAAEKWEEALEKQIDILVIDDTVRMARDAREKLKRWIELRKKIEAYLARPDMLTKLSGREEAGLLLNEVDQLVASKQLVAPKFAQTVEKLRGQVGEYESPVAVGLTSDGKTRVDVYRVGQFGTFKKKSLSLLPGTYTVVGARKGYRDVRLELIIKPGQDATQLDVRCKEKF